MPQRVMRQRVEKMSQYQVLKDFHFVDLMTMAEFYEERTFVYSQYLYKEGSTPQQIYLIEEGQFQFTRLQQDNKESQTRSKLKEKLLRKKNVSKQKREAIDFQDTAQYNTTKPVKLKQFRVGTILGGVGQSMGEEEIILGKQKRIYNAKCTSTKNKVIVIKKEHIINIFNANPKLLDGLKSEVKEKEKIVHRAHKKIQSVRLNMQNFVKLVHQQQTIKQRQSTQATTTDRVDKDLKLPYLSRRNQTQTKKKKDSLGLIHQKHTTRTFNESSMTIDKMEKSRVLQDLIEETDEGSETFALTAFQNSTSALKKKLEEKVKLFNKQEQIIEQESNYDDYIPLKASKSWNIKSISPQKLLAKQKYRGMIDSTALIKEKQHILEIKRKSNEVDDRIEFEQKHKKILKQTQLEKERSKKSSTAHSKEYMEKMLLNALKKAGYQESAPQIQKAKKLKVVKNTELQQLGTQTPVDEAYHVSGQFKYLKTDKIVMKLKKKKRQFFEPISEILERSPFDECYFSNIA